MKPFKSANLEHPSKLAAHQLAVYESPSNSAVATIAAQEKGAGCDAYLIEAEQVFDPVLARLFAASPQALKALLAVLTITAERQYQTGKARDLCLRLYDTIVPALEATTGMEAAQVYDMVSADAVAAVCPLSPLDK